MITALTRLGITVLLVAATTAGISIAAAATADGAAAQALKAEPATAGDGGSTKAVPPATDPANAAAKDLAPLPLELPKPKFTGTRKNLPPGTRVKINKDPNKPREPFLAPKGTRNVAFKRPVTSSDMEPVIGTLDLVTNGVKEAIEEAFVELGPGVQWVQIDLGSAMPIHAIVLWHEHSQPLVYHDVVIQVSDDKDFITNVRTLFNNDHDNSAGLGIGEDWGYYETNEGLLAPAKGVKARYVRLYSNGSTGDDLNRYTEVEVYATPAGTVTTKPAAAPHSTGPEAKSDQSPLPIIPPKPIMH